MIYKHQNEDNQSLINNHVLCLAEDKKNNLWIGTANGLSRLNLKTNKITNFFTKTESNLANDRILSILIDSKNRLLLGTNDGISVYHSQTESFRSIDLGGKIKNETVTKIYETKDNKLYIGTISKGIFVVNSNFEVLQHFHTASTPIRLTSNNISDIYEDSKNQVWISSGNFGLNKIDAEKQENITFTKENSNLGNNNIRSIVETDNSLIIGTFEGLYRLDLSNNQISSFGSFNIAEGMLSHYSIHSLLVDKANTLWVGTYAGGVNYYSKYSNQFYIHNPTSKLGSYLGIFGSVTCLSESSLWIATEGGGLLEYNYNTGSYNNYLIDNTQKGAYDNNILKALLYENGKIWCGTNKGEIYLFDPVRKNFTLKYRFPMQSSIYFIFRDSNNELWVGTSAPEVGLYNISSENQIINEFQMDDGSGFQLASLRCIAEIRKNAFLFGTRSSGLIK